MKRDYSMSINFGNFKTSVRLPKKLIDDIQERLDFDGLDRTYEILLGNFKKKYEIDLKKQEETLSLTLLSAYGVDRKKLKILNNPTLGYNKKTKEIMDGYAGESNKDLIRLECQTYGFKVSDNDLLKQKTIDEGFTSFVNMINQAQKPCIYLHGGLNGIQTDSEIGFFLRFVDIGEALREN